MFRLIPVLVLFFGCAASKEPSSNDAGQTSCDSLQTNIERTFSDYLAAHRTCVIDADCVQADLGSGACADPCGGVVSRVNAAAATTFALELCKPLQSQGCTVPDYQCGYCGVGCNAGVCVCAGK